MNNPHPQHPDTWVPYKKGMCSDCWGGCCTLPVEASVHDLIRLEWITEEEACSFSAKQIAKKLEKEKKIQAFQNKTQLFILAQRGGRDCFLLEEKSRLCTVYNKRPEVCRQFPKIGPKPTFCPSFKK